MLGSRMTISAFVNGSRLGSARSRTTSPVSSPDSSEMTTAVNAIGAWSGSGGACDRAERGHRDLAVIAPAHVHVHLPLAPSHRAPLHLEIRRDHLLDLALPRVGALGAAVAARLRRRGDLARLQVGEEHRLLVLAGELEQSQPRRETLDRHHDRQTQNRERDQHLEQREAGMIPAAPAWPGRRGPPFDPCLLGTASDPAPNRGPLTGATLSRFAWSNGGLRRPGHAGALEHPGCPPPERVHSLVFFTRPVIGSTVTR